MTNLSVFDLIQVSLGQKTRLPCNPTTEQWQRLYNVAKKQSILGICFRGIQALHKQQQCPPEDLYDKWMGVSATIQMKNSIVNKKCSDLIKELEKNGFKCCILKGQSIAYMYGRELSYSRQSGDIDIWVKAKRDKIVNYVMNISPTKKIDFKHIDFNIFEDIPVELHMVPVRRYNPRRNHILGKYFASEVDRQCQNKAMIGGYEMTVPTADFQLIHQLLHVYSHYVYEGVGMRQLMDLYFAQLAVYADNKRSEYYKKTTDLFSKLGLSRFVAATQWVLKQVFLLEDEKLLCKADPKEGQRLLDDIMEGGNFGQYSEKNSITNETFSHRLLRRMRQSLKMIRFDFLGIICAPWYRIRIELWRRQISRKYGV